MCYSWAHTCLLEHAFDAANISIEVQHVDNLYNRYNSAHVLRLVEKPII